MPNAILNITFNGLSGDLPAPLESDTPDEDIRRIAIEVITQGGIDGMRFPDAPRSTFDNYVVDRFGTPAGGHRIYLRPKVPFGA